MRSASETPAQAPAAIFPKPSVSGVDNADPLSPMKALILVSTLHSADIRLPGGLPQDPSATDHRTESQFGKPGWKVPTVDAFELGDRLADLCTVVPIVLGIGVHLPPVQPADEIDSSRDSSGPAIPSLPAGDGTRIRDVQLGNLHVD